MTPALCLSIPSKEYHRVRKHLFSHGLKSEGAAFIFARVLSSRGKVNLESLHSYVVQVSDCAYKSEVGFELTDDCQSRIIKQAHDLGASLVELHSHPRSATARFSASDQIGFADFVPHVWWRLKHRPYAAVVMAPGGFDSLCWISGPHRPDGVLELRTGVERLVPTGLTFQTWEHSDGF